MFAARFFGRRYYGARFFGAGGKPPPAPDPILDKITFRTDAAARKVTVTIPLPAPGDSVRVTVAHAGRTIGKTVAGA